MAKFLSIYVTTETPGLTSGERLINAEQITTVAQTAATTTVITLAQAGTSFDQITLTHTSTGTTPSVRDAINDAITAVPGGQTVAVSMPVGIVCSAIALA
jgi:hypothetical protein